MNKSIILFLETKNIGQEGGIQNLGKHKSWEIIQVCLLLLIQYENLFCSFN